MLAKLPQIIFALLVMGAVFGIAALMLVVLHQDWEDVLLWLLAAVMIGSGLLVVTMRDIIRCGLAMIVCFIALAGIYVIVGAPLVAAAQVLVYIGAISVLILFAIMLTETKSAPSRLVFQTQAVPAAVAGQVQVRRRMRMTMSCDHRVIDGATGAQFLKTLKLLLENPLALVW